MEQYIPPRNLVAYPLLAIPWQEENMGWGPMGKTTKI